jgi:hypothetical protein
VVDGQRELLVNKTRGQDGYVHARRVNVPI